MKKTEANSSLKTKNQTLHFKTKGEFEFIDFTDKVVSFVKDSGVKNGFLNIQTLHTTATVLINENEPLLIEDMKKNFKTLAEKNIYYGHNDFSIRTVNMCDGECKNGHSHCLALYLPTNVLLNVVDGKIQFGQWQRVFLVELDHSRSRGVSLQIMGE